MGLSLCGYTAVAIGSYSEHKEHTECTLCVGPGDRSDEILYLS